MSPPTPPITRRSFIRLFTRGLLFSGISGASAFAYGSFIERRRPTVERIEVRLRGLGSAFDGFRIVQISDLHVEPNVDRDLLTRSVAIINGLKPDLITLTGDYVTHDTTRVAQLTAPLAALTAPAGVIASLGNHDIWTSPSKVSSALRQHGMTVLRNSGLALTKQQDSLWIAGLDSAWAGRPDVAKSLNGRPSSAPTVILSHEPDYVDTLSPHIPGSSLQLAGHTHGGQVCLPGGFPLLLPKWGKKYPKGLFRIGRMQLYVNRGLGTIGPKTRFACSPEITELTLRSF